MRLTEIYQRLKLDISGHAFIAEPISRSEDIYLAADFGGRPALFITASEEFVGPPLRTFRISLRPAEPYLLTMSDGTRRQETFHALFCDATEGPDVGTFLVLLEAFLTGRESAGSPSYADLTDFFRSMIRLFAIQPVSNLKLERQGLWGELFMMSRVRGFRFWVPFWHNPVTQLFDYSAPGRRVEVKTTLGPGRIHHFSHRQIFALDSEQIMVVSFLLKEDDAGLSLADLIAECRIALSGTYHYLKLEAAARRAGMEGGPDVGPRFDATAAEAGLSWYRSTELPHFRLPEPPGVSETSYRVDVALATPLERPEIEKWLDNWLSGDPLEALIETK